MTDVSYRAVVIGGSAGSMAAIERLLYPLDPGFPLPIIVVTHLHPKEDGSLVSYFNTNARLEVREVKDKEMIHPGTVYFPPANYHLLVERDQSFALSTDAKVNFSRPSIDLLFESAAFTWDSGLVGILLTGASSDGAAGIGAIKKYGGLTIAQDPAEAPHPFMPQAAIATGKVDHIMTIAAIGDFISQVAGGDRSVR